jgi:hypothetical protein
MTKDGDHRAEYLARCMAADTSSAALPLGSPTLVMAQYPKKGHSHRAYDLVKPVADALGLGVYDKCEKGDADCVVKKLQTISAGDTVVLAWEHKDIAAELVPALNIADVPDKFDTWPTSCDALSWPEPADYDDRGGSTCYDAIWQVQMTRGSSSEPWTFTSIKWLQEGFGGHGKKSPCAEGLAPKGQVAHSVFI